MYPQWRCLAQPLPLRKGALHHTKTLLGEGSAWWRSPVFGVSMILRPRSWN